MIASDRLITSFQIRMMLGQPDSVFRALVNTRFFSFPLAYWSTYYAPRAFILPIVTCRGKREPQHFRAEHLFGRDNKTESPYNWQFAPTLSDLVT